MVFKPTPKLERNVESVVEKIWQNDVKMEDLKKDISFKNRMKKASK